MEKLYKLEAPYPELTAKKPNKFYVSILTNLYASCQSEMTAVLQYTFQEHYFEKTDQQAADDVIQIAIVEMHHLELLAHAIICYGGKPKYVNSKNMYYSAKAVDYSTDYITMLLSDLTEEKKAIAAYNNAISMISDKDLKALLNRINDDEKLHYKIFEGLLMQAQSLML